MALTVFKSINSLNPPCLNDIFSKKSVPYRMRDSCKIEQPRRRTTTFGLRSFSYVGAKVWNELPTYRKETTDLNDLSPYWIPGMDQKWTSKYNILLFVIYWVLCLQLFTILTFSYTEPRILILISSISILFH